jgi:membrane associated rhomboid family serine protease
MGSARNAKSFFEFPHGMVQLLLGACLVVFALCYSQAGTASIPSDVLFRYGAMYSQALERHEYWRLITYGFLHANPVHLLVNMLCLVLWGGLLERRVESLYFTVIYLSGLIVGAIVSKLSHPGPYLGVGASGAISAVLGALLCLRILGKIDLSWSFFVTNIGLNVVLAASSSRIDWQAHFGGFAAGVICCACLDILEKAMPWVLRCKFPEFAKMNSFVAFVIVVAYCWSSPLVVFKEAWVFAVVSGFASLVAIKMLDLMLSMKKGLVVVVIIFALTNAVLVLLLGSLFSQAMVLFCVTGNASSAAIVVAKACSNLDLVINLTSASVAALTLLIYWPQLARGIADVGFVAASLRGERVRRQGV